MNAPVRHMKVLDSSGHMEVTWSEDDAGQVAAAKATFEAMRSKGYSAFVSEGGEKGKRMDVFDPSAEALILVPQLRGG